MSFEIFLVALFLLLALCAVTLFSLVTFLLERPNTTIFRVVMEETKYFFNFFSRVQQPNSAIGHLTVEVSRPHNYTNTSASNPLYK